MASAHTSRSLSHPLSPDTIHHGIHETCSPILSVEKQLVETLEESRTQETYPIILQIRYCIGVYNTPNKDPFL